MEKLHKHIHDFQDKGNVFWGWFKEHKAFSWSLSVAILIFVSIIIFIMVYYRDKAAPGTTVADTSVSGQNVKQIEQTIDSIVKNVKLSLTYNGKSVTASASDLGLAIDVEKISKQVVATGQRDPLSVVALHKNFNLTGSYDKQKVKDFVTKNYPELTADAKDSTVVYSKEQNKFIVQPGAIGKSIKLPELFGAVDNLLKSPRIASYEIDTSDTKPTVDEAGATRATERANQSVGSTIRIINNGKVIWTLDPPDIASWTVFTADANINGYGITYDKSKIIDFVNNTVAGQLSNKPVNQVAITDKNGQVLQEISPGQNGQVPSNASEVASTIYDYLRDGKSGNVTLESKDSSFKTDGAVAQDNHWIEANLSTFEVKLYDGNNVTWSTNQTSQGKIDTPTITGLHKVWRKVYNQCMPNPPSPDPLCNIHYVTYWEASGYAFHEAWWLNSGNINKGISHGCINMLSDDAKRVYDWSSIGTPVWVHR